MLDSRLGLSFGLVKWFGLHKPSIDSTIVLALGLALTLGFNLPIDFAVAAAVQPPREDLTRPTLTESPPVSEAPLDLKTAVRKAIDNNNTIQQAKQKVEQAKNDIGTTRALIFPNLSLVGSAGEYKNAVSSGNAAAFGGSAYNQYSADLKLTQPLLYFGSFSAINVADYQIKINEIDLELAVRSLTNNVIQTFYRVLVNQRLVEILERTQAVVNESLSTAQRRLQTGRGQLLDVLQVKTEIALLKPQIEDAHNQLESAGAALATLLAEEGKYELQLRGTLRGLQLKEVQKRMNFKDARLPELERVRLTREQLSQQMNVVEGKHLPYLGLIGDYGTSSFTKSEISSDYSRNWSVVLQLTIPLFSGFQSIYERRGLNAQDRQLEYQGRDLENSLALAQVQSLKALQSAGASLVSSEEAADLADQSMAEARRNFRLATIDFLQFLTVEKSTLQADSSLNQIKYNNIVAFANYFIATGQPLSNLVDMLQEKNK